MLTEGLLTIVRGKRTHMVVVAATAEVMGRENFSRRTHVNGGLG
jgi:hypothetical protein